MFACRHARSRRGRSARARAKPATPSCSRPPAPASISSKISSIAAANSSGWCKSWRRAMARLQDRLDPVPDHRRDGRLRPGDALQRLQRASPSCAITSRRITSSCARSAGPSLSFLVLMYFKRMDYRRLNTPAWAFSGLGNRAGAAGAGLFRRPAHAPLVQDSPGVGSFQPSEFAKPALILFLAYFIARRAHVINDRRTLKQALVAVADAGASWWWWRISAPRWCR